MSFKGRWKRLGSYSTDYQHRWGGTPLDQYEHWHRFITCRSNWNVCPAGSICEWYDRLTPWSSARECDERVAAEVQASFKTGIFKNPRNDAYTRMQRGTTRNTNSFNKVREAKAKHKKRVAVDEQIEILTKGGMENCEMLKVLKAEKKNLRTGVNGEGRVERWRLQEIQSRLVLRQLLKPERMVRSFVPHNSYSSDSKFPQ